MLRACTALRTPHPRGDLERIHRAEDRQQRGQEARRLLAGELGAPAPEDVTCRTPDAETRIPCLTCMSLSVLLSAFPHSHEQAC